MAALVLLFFFMFSLCGLLLVGAINKYTHACRVLKEAQDMHKRVLMIKGRQTWPQKSKL